MTLYDAATRTALELAQTEGRIVIRDYVSIFGWDDVGDPDDWHFWTGAANVTVSVVSAQDGTTDSRSYIGGGSLIETPPIVEAIGLEARRHDFVFSQLHATVQDMVRGNNIRLAILEMQRGIFDPTTMALVSTPFPRFLGRVDGVSIETPEAGGEGRIVISAISGVIDLTRVNPALKSDETQRLRSDDRFRRYADTAAQVEVRWGQAKGSAD